jgi:hypothetical protein
MASGTLADELDRGMHIYPALSGSVLSALGNLSADE